MALQQPGNRVFTNSNLRLEYNQLRGLKSALTVAVEAGGLTNWMTNYVNGVALSSSSATAYLGNAIRVTTNWSPGGTYTVSSNLYGRLISVTQFDNSGTQVGQVTNGYDAHGRQNMVCDARNGTTTYYFNNADQIVGTVTPVPATGMSAEVTSLTTSTLPSG